MHNVTFIYIGCALSLQKHIFRTLNAFFLERIQHMMHMSVIGHIFDVEKISKLQPYHCALGVWPHTLKVSIITHNLFS